MGRKSKLSFFRSVKKPENETKKNALSSDNLTSTSNDSTISANEASDDRDAQVTISVSPRNQRLTLQSPSSSRRLGNNAMFCNRWSQSELNLPRPSPHSNHQSSPDTLNKANIEGWNEPNSNENFRGIHYEDSTSTLESQLDPNLYHSTVSQYTYSNSTPVKSLRKGLSFASTPNLRASRIISEKDSDVPELPSSESSKPTKTVMKGFGRLLQKTGDKPSEVAISNERATDSASHSHSRQHQQAPGPRRKKRYPSIMKLPSHETFFKSKLKLVEPQTVNQNLQNQHDHFKNSKIHIRKPPPGTQHWFDALDPDEDDIDSEIGHIRGEGPFDRASTERKGSHSSQMQPMPSPLSAPSSNRANKAEPEMSDQKGSFSHRNDRRKDSLSMDETATTSGNAFTKAKNSHGDRSGPFQARASGFCGSNLLNQSILLLSSDDDDDGDNNVFHDSLPHKDLQLRRRTSLARRVKSAEVVGKMGRIDLSKTSSNNYLGRPFTLNNNSIRRGESQGDPRIRSVSRVSSLSSSKGDVNKLRSHARQHSLIKEEEGSTKDPGVQYHGSSESTQPWLASSLTTDPSDVDANAGSGPNSEVSSSMFASKNAQNGSSKYLEHRKMIEVTEEEEALLQLMRSKRISTAKRSFTEGYINSLNVERRDNLTRQRKKKLPGMEKPRTSAFLVLDSPMGSAFPKPPSSRSSSQAHPLPKTPLATTKASRSMGNGPPVEFPKRVSSIRSGTSPITLTRHRSFDTFRQIAHTDSLPGSTTASTIMPSDSISAYGYAPASDPSHLPPLPGLGSVPSQLALSQALAYDSNDMFPSPTTAPNSSPSTPVFKPTSAYCSTGVEVIGSDSDIIADVLPGIMGRSRAETKGSSVIVIEKDDEFSTVTAGSISAVEIGRPNKIGTQVRRSRQVSDAAKDASRPTSSKSSLPSARTSIGNDVLSAWKALGGVRNFEQVAVETYA